MSQAIVTCDYKSRLTLGTERGNKRPSNDILVGLKQQLRETVTIGLDTRRQHPEGILGN